MTIFNSHLRTVSNVKYISSNDWHMTRKKYEPWYKTAGLKHITGFVTPAEKTKLKKLALAADKSLSRYVTRLIQTHIREMETVMCSKK